MDSQTIRGLAKEWQGVALDDDAAARLATLSNSVVETLDTLAGHSMFDTEPVHFDRALIAMAEGGK